MSDRAQEMKEERRARVAAARIERAAEAARKEQEEHRRKTEDYEDAAFWAQMTHWHNMQEGGLDPISAALLTVAGELRLLRREIKR